MEMRRSVLFLCAYVMTCGAFASECVYPQIINIRDRETVSLDGKWEYIVDPQLVGYLKADYSRLPDRRTFFADRSFAAEKTWLFENTFDGAPTLDVPGDWNTQDDRLFYYEGHVWYRRQFDYEPEEGKRVFLYFGAVNYEAIVALNGKIIGTHTGGFTPFNFEVTGKLKKGRNHVVVLVDNTRRVDTAPALVSDWWNYGGITRSVKLIELPQTFVRNYSVQLDKTSTRRIIGKVTVDGARPGQEVNIAIPELKAYAKSMISEDGTASFEMKARPELWSPESPKLYDVEISAGEDKVCDKIGFRHIEVVGGKMLLNGVELFCRGVCLHEEAPFTCRRIRTVEECRTLLDWAKEMNCNFVRLAHYPYNEDMVRLAEEMGILVWEEIPLWWSIDWTNETIYRNAAQQLDEMMTRDINRANVIIWSVANETPISDARNKFLTGLISQIRAKDQTRLVSAAVLNKIMREDGVWTIEDPILAHTDIISFNIYMGWYTRMENYAAEMNWAFIQNKPVFISEFGGGALAGLHGDEDEYFTEEKQAKVYHDNLEMLSRMPCLCGTAPWILVDFRSVRRPMTGIQDGFNRKGLISEQGQRKQAFHIMRKWYEDKKKSYE